MAMRNALHWEAHRAMLWIWRSRFSSSSVFRRFSFFSCPGDSSDFMLTLRFESLPSEYLREVSLPSSRGSFNVSVPKSIWMASNYLALKPLVKLLLKVYNNRYKLRAQSLLERIPIRPRSTDRNEIIQLYALVVHEFLTLREKFMAFFLYFLSVSQKPDLNAFETSRVRSLHTFEPGNLPERFVWFHRLAGAEYLGARAYCNH
jgi:hypothetical protein